MTALSRRDLIAAVVGLVWLVSWPALAQTDAGRATDSSARTPAFSGIYPHLASFNSQGECGTGAVVPWADKLWWVTYSPHMPQGSDDKLYSMDDAFHMAVFPGSVGGTPANRFIHRETNQLLIGPYVIDAQGQVRVIPQTVMPGRLTGNARHLRDPAHRVYYATMEEGFYEVDLTSLQVHELFPDANQLTSHAGPLLPGYHGKGLYSGQGVLVYANNGELSDRAMTQPDIESGVLAEWPGEGDWRVVRRNQFTEVTGPGGLSGNANPTSDPIWSIGWDHRSLILMVRAGNAWHAYRLPKGSHCYDGAHGWNTEWPRIREVGERDLLMTMHGTFWSLPKTFHPRRAQGLRPRSTYLKVIGDFCRWRDQIVFGCDDAAKNEFLNTRKAKGKVAGPAQSQSNLWFTDPDTLDSLGPVLGHGAVWVNELVKKSAPSDPFLFAGFPRRAVHLVNHSPDPVVFHLEVDRAGDGNWLPMTDVTVSASGYDWHPFSEQDEGEWIRVSVSHDCLATAWFEYGAIDARAAAPSDSEQTAAGHFAGMARAGQEQVLGGLVRAGDRDTGLHILATQISNGRSEPSGYYLLRPDLTLTKVESPDEEKQLRQEIAIPIDVLQLDGHSILYQDDDGRRYRMPIGNRAYLNHPELLNLQRTSREVVTERDLFQCAGTFFELPARNAGGFARIRPIATHRGFIQDYCSWRGLLVLTGTDEAVRSGIAHWLRADDGNCAVWLGAVDDLWQLGKPVGCGGPWADSLVRAGEPSDPYLCLGYDRKSLTMTHDATETVSFRLEVDITGTGLWQTLESISAAPAVVTTYRFPPGFQAYWVRLVSDKDCTATADFIYE